MSSLEGQSFDKKSLRTITARRVDWSEQAKDCVAFSNALGGHIYYGIENDEDEPPIDQKISDDLLDQITKRISELTVNVLTNIEVKKGASGGEYIDLFIPRSVSVASTSDGRYYLRVSDQCKPVLGDEIMRLATDRSAFSWETLTTIGVKRTEADIGKQTSFLKAIRDSDRVKDSVKEKSSDEILDHYFLAQGDYLTNLGILCLGKPGDRARLGTAPMIQFIKYDELGQKVNKISWDDHNLSPMELVEAVWLNVPDFREAYELPDGLFRQELPAYDEIVIRELLVNALVHRPYTQRGDIFLNLHPDKLEVVNPGLLPLGVTPNNILHVTVRRNEHLARVFHDLKLMEREGSGFDRIYEVLLSQGRPIPEIREGSDRVEVTVKRRIINPKVIDFIMKTDQYYPLSQRERITLGLLAQYDSPTSKELVKLLELSSDNCLKPWLGRLNQWGIVTSSGRTQATRYFIVPDLLRKMDFKTTTTLRRIEPHRLQALIVEDLKSYPGSAFGDIQKRVAQDVPPNQLKRAIKVLINNKKIVYNGEKRWRRYWLIV
jgi:ATP-dependent DNA helicase RecG